MAIIYKVSRFPAGNVPEGVIYYNRTTREILTSVEGVRRKFQAIFVPKEVDVISVQGYYPLLSSELLAKQRSPFGTATPYGLAELGPPPPGVTYPVWMPDGASNGRTGDHISPGGDDDGDGILNFRDPDILGVAALPTVGYIPPSPYITSGGASVSIVPLLSSPDSGTLNNTNNDVVAFVHSSGIIVGPNGEIKYFIGPGAASIPPNWVLFHDVGETSSPLPEPAPAYTGDPFVTAGGSSVNIKNFISNPSEGSHNGTGFPIEIDTIDSGIIVCDDGSVTYFLPGKVTIPSGCTMFRDKGNSSSPLPGPTPAYTEDPFNANNQALVNLKDYLTEPDSGSLNSTGAVIEIQVTEVSILVALDGTVTVLTPTPGTHQIPPGFVLFTEVSEFVGKFTSGGGTLPTVPVSNFNSIQWFQEDGSGNLELRTAEFTDSSGLQYWETSGLDSYTPRDAPYNSTTEDFQYFEEDSNGHISPTTNPN
tara:strand:+ start:36 stop:1469 length:1434 start_codon:yes stop_codon:yes gene_type:complete